ncbi:MAG: molecular chaperone DnaJ [Anaerolineales bacterium]|nr:molecular chaperone DnaJ [Anaerolineales bacterium]
MAAKRDYYEILGLNRNASEDEIKSCYRRLAKKFHPDVNKNPDAEERFKEINEAYAVLSDDERKAAFDRFGHAGLEGMPFGFDFDFMDIFNEFFGFGTGRRRSRRAPRRGVNLRYEMTLTFEEAIFGADKEIGFARQETCSTCNGSGAEPGTTPIRCETCGGSGEVRQVRQTFLGSMVNVSTCLNCAGQGETIKTPCKTCNGNGRVRNQITREIPIPAGVDDGTQIRVAGEGEPGINGGPRGDLYIVIHVKPHQFFRRRGEDILLDMEINLAQAALGADITIPTVDGEETVRIPAGTQPGKVLRLKGKGVPRLNRNSRGDQLVVVSIEIPRSLTPEQRKLFEDLAQSLGTEVHFRERSFLDQLKEFFGGLAD